MRACAQYNDDWTPAHLTRRPTNLYGEAALTLKGLEWRKPGLVAVAAKLAVGAGERQPLEFEVPEAYKPKAGPNPWTAERGDEPGPSRPASADDANRTRKRPLVAEPREIEVNERGSLLANEQPAAFIAPVLPPASTDAPATEHHSTQNPTQHAVQNLVANASEPIAVWTNRLSRALFARDGEEEGATDLHA